jgi:zinc protease
MTKVPGVFASNAPSVLLAAAGLAWLLGACAGSPSPSVHGPSPEGVHAGPEVAAPPDGSEGAGVPDPPQPDGAVASPHADPGAAHPRGDTLRPVGREAVERLTFPPLVLDPPSASEHQVLGVTVYHLHDPALPLVDLFVQMRGGSAHFPRDQLGPLTGFSHFIRNGGTLELPPDSVDRRVDLLALQLGFGSGGTGSFATLNSLRSTFDEGLQLFQGILTRPGFDRETVEVWRGQELERVRRRPDNPGGLAFDEFNRLMFGDHPVGWVLEEGDLEPDRFTDERLREIQAELLCRDRLILGLAGDLSWDEAEPRIRRFLEAWPSCTSELEDAPEPELRREGGVFILPRPVEQSTIVMAHPGGLRQEASPDFFASRVANLILGGGGFTSRLMARVRTERGLAYGASSLWTTPLRYEGLVGALTSTAPEQTVEATGLLLEILDEFRSEPPREEEVTLAVDQISNGHVFAFQSARQIVARRMGNLAQDLPEDWLEIYLEGIQQVGVDDVFRVARERIDPERMTILIVGDPARFDPGIEALGRLHRLSLDGTITAWEGTLPGAEEGDGSP